MGNIIGTIRLCAGDSLMLNMRLSLALLLIATSIACAPARQSTVQPQPDQVAFFDRPLTLVAARQSKMPAPTIVLLEPDPWSNVLGSDSPSFVLYEDGTVIRRTANGYGISRLSGEQQTQFLKGLNIEALRPWYGRFVVEQATDQPEQDLLVYRGKQPLFISVYGSLKEPSVRAKVPGAIVAAFDRIKEFKHAPTNDWLPEKIEVMIWPYEYAPDASIKWPAEWPDLSDPSTMKRGDSFSIFVPSSELAELKAFLSRRKEKGAIEIDGKKWAASIRFPLPHEKLWMAPHPELKDTKG